MKDTTLNQALFHAVEKIRIGHANNSSSSHSIVIGKMNDKLLCDEYRYGWENFVLGSSEEKDKYMRILLYINLNNTIEIRSENFPGMNYDVIKQIKHTNIISVFGFNNISLEGISKDIYIDHQSVLILPIDGNKKISIEFWKDLYDYIVNNDFSIIGGNDNSEYIDRSAEEVHLPFYRDRRDYSIFALKDAVKNIWIIKNSQTGSVITMNFNKINSKKTNKNFKPEIEKTSFPLLVDLNIIDKCMNNCANCYRDCTKDGKEADDKVIKTICKTLNNYPIVDIVIGGGDITLSKADMFSSYYTSINKPYISISTTIHQATPLDRLNKIQGASSVAVSLTDTTEKGIEQFITLFNELKIKYVKDIICQIIFEDFYTNLGTDGFISLIEKLYKAKIYSFSFVGYKQAGRAKKKINTTINKIKNSSFFPTLIKEINKRILYSLRIYFDSVMVERYGDCISVNEIFKVGREGIHSCYIDAVNLYMAKNSYSEEKFPFTTDNFEKEFINIWNKI